MNVWLCQPFFDEDGMLGTFDEIFVPDDEERWSLEANWDKGIRGKHLPKMKLASLVDTGRFPYNKSDFPVCSTSIVFSEKAAKTYGDLLNERARYLSIDCDCSDKYYLVDLPVVDCLDHEKSVIDYYPPGSRSIAGFDRFAFKADIVANETIFQIPESRARIFVTDIFIERAKTAGLAGISFVKVWNEEKGSFSFLKVAPENKVILG